MRSNNSRIISRTRVSALALAAVLAAAASDGAFAMLTAEDPERSASHSGSQGVHAVSLGKPGHVILKREARSEPFGYSTAGDRVGRLPADKGQERG